MMNRIGVDWGSSNVRAFCFADDGTVADRRTSGAGAAGLAPEGFSDALAQLTAGWANSDTTILIAGMAGARGGWRETPYLACPADPGAIAAATVAVAPNCRIVPGVATAHDVMRGEETQITGADVADGLVVLPGTHSKWAHVADDAIVDFATAITGELFALLRTRSVLAKLAVADAPHDDEAFLRGAARGLADGATASLFSARAEVLLGGLAPEAVESYLSGLLIGGEVAAMRGCGAAEVLVGDPVLCERYAAAMTLGGAAPARTIAGETAAARGLWTIMETMA